MGSCAVPAAGLPVAALHCAGVRSSNARPEPSDWHSQPAVYMQYIQRGGQTCAMSHAVQTHSSFVHVIQLHKEGSDALCHMSVTPHLCMLSWE